MSQMTHYDIGCNLSDPIHCPVCGAYAPPRAVLDRAVTCDHCGAILIIDAGTPSDTPNDAEMTHPLTPAERARAS